MKCFSLWFAALFYYMLCIRALHAPTDGKCIFGIHLPNRTVYNFSSAVQKNGFFFPASGISGGAPGCQSLGISFHIKQ